MEIQKFIITPHDAALCIIDIQDSLFNTMEYEMRKKVTKNVSILIEMAKLYSMPIIVTEQYRKGLGPTIKELLEKIEGIPIYDKVTFDCMKDDNIRNAIYACNRKNIILCGIETHICVLTTALSLLREGFTVIIASDAVCSRRTHEWDMALHALRQAHAIVYPTETIAFMILERAGTEMFKKLSPLFK